MKMKKVVSLLSLTLFVGSSLMAQNLNKGLVIHSTFDKDAADLSQNHFNGKLKGASISKEGIIGDGCVYFNGKDSYVEYPRNKVYFNGDYSISIWCKMVTADLWVRILDFNQDKPQVGNSVTWLIGRSHQQGTHDMWFDQWVTYKGIAVESIPDIMQQNPANAYLHYNIVPNEWAHYVITYNSKAKNPNGIVKNRKGEEVPLEGIVTLYVNGKKVGTNDFCLKPQNAPTLANWLGRSRFAPDPYYNGYMDDFRIYNRILSPKEIQKLYSLKNK